MARPDLAAQPTDPAETEIRRFVRARRAGREDEMREAWKRFVVAELARIRALVSVKRSDALPGGRLSPEDRDEIVQDVYLRVLKTLNFHGESVGEAKEYIRTAAEFQFRDHIRRHVTEDRRRGRSLDEPAPDGSGPGPGALEAEARAARDAEDEGDRAVTGVLLDEALRRVSENKREVVRLRLEGWSAREVAEELGISEDNVHQRHRRGLKELGDALGLDP